MLSVHCLQIKDPTITKSVWNVSMDLNEENIELDV